MPHGAAARSWERAANPANRPGGPHAAIRGGPDLCELDACLASGMLHADRTHVAFRHELARLAIEDAITPNRRLALHRQALAALAERGSDFASLAHHAEAAGDRDAVLRWAPRAAAQAVSSSAHREAEAQYARALRFAQDASPQVRAELLQGWADECYVTAQFESAIEALQEAPSCPACAGRPPR